MPNPRHYDPVKQNINKLRACGMEIRNAIQLVGVAMDQATRQELRKSLDTCAERLQSVSRALAIVESEPAAKKK